MAEPLPLPEPTERKRIAHELGVPAHTIAAVVGIGTSTYQRWTKRADLPLTPMTELYHKVMAVLASHLAAIENGDGTNAH